MKTLDKFVGLVAAFSFIAMMALIFLSIGIDSMIAFTTARHFVDWCVVALAVAGCYGAARGILRNE